MTEFERGVEAMRKAVVAELRRRAEFEKGVGWQTFYEAGSAEMARAFGARAEGFTFMAKFFEEHDMTEMPNV